MTDIRNGHIQGDLTISPSLTDPGLLSVNLLEETTSSSGISILNSNLKIGKKIQFKNSGVFSTDLQLQNDNLFKVQNNAGSIQVSTSIGKGLQISDTSGDTVITSTTDSIDENTGSLITLGGAVVKKTLNVCENVNALDGIHLFKNTAGAQNVIDVINTNISGKSSVYFKNSSGLSKLEIGWGNSGAVSPLNDNSYIQSLNGSELLLRADSQDCIKLSTNGSVDFFSTLASSSSSAGAVKLLGGLSISNTTDATSVSSGGTFTTSGGASISKKLFLGSSLNIAGIASPSAPVAGASSFYIDISDNLFKSKTNSGTVTVYQPNTTKGDISTHDGNIAIRLPSGPDGYFLVSNSSTSSGLEWVNSSIGGGGSTDYFIKYLLTSVNLKSIILEDSVGSYFFSTYPCVENGASCIFFISKSVASASGVSARFNSNSSLLSGGQISISYPAYKGVDIRKSYSEGDGLYSGYSNEKFVNTDTTLSGTSWSSLGISDTTGCFCFSVTSFNDGPCATFLLVKNSSSLNSGNITRIISSSVSGNSLSIRWLAGTYPEIRKSLSNNDGVYNITNNFQDSLSSTFSLSGTSRTTIDRSVFSYYENKTLIIKVSSSISGSPNAIFTISKNRVTRVGNSTAYRSPGVSSGELLSIFWDSTSLLQLSKSGLNYDGVYDISFVKLE